MAVIVGTLASATLIELGFGTDLGIDQLLFRETKPASSLASPGRMAMMTAVNFALLAAALLLIDVETPRGKRPSNWLALAISTNCFVAILGYVYDVDALYRIAELSAVALPTAILFVVIGIGTACARPRSYFIGHVVGEGEAALINRRLLPVAILIPPLIGWLDLEGQRAGYYSTAFGLALFAASIVAVFAALVWWNARALQRAHEQRTAALRHSDWQSAMINSADFTMISTDTQGVIRTINEGAASMLGYTQAELVDRATPELIHEPIEVMARAAVLSKELGFEVHPGFEALVAKARLAGTDENIWTYIRKDGSRFPVRLSVTSLTDPNGELTGFLAIGKDITAKLLAEKALRDSERRLRSITDNVPAIIAYLDHEERYRFCNRLVGKALGVDNDMVIGRTMKEVRGEALYAGLAEHVEAALRGETVTFEGQGEYENIHRFFQTSYIPDAADDGQIRGFYAITFDISAQKEVQAKLRQLTEVDNLTGLANRLCFDEKLVEAIANSEEKGHLMALAFLDLDNFKSINDTSGHQGGDLVLQEFARRLSDNVRPTDTVARLAGDEFVIILEPIRNSGDADIVAEKIVAAMRAPFDILDTQRTISCSMGIAVRRAGEIGGETLRRADVALYKVKESGRGHFLVDR